MPSNSDGRRTAAAARLLAAAGSPRARCHGQRPGREAPRGQRHCSTRLTAGRQQPRPNKHFRTVLQCKTGSRPAPCALFAARRWWLSAAPGCGQGLAAARFDLRGLYHCHLRVCLSEGGPICPPSLPASLPGPPPFQGPCLGPALAPRRLGAPLPRKLGGGAGGARGLAEGGCQLVLPTTSTASADAGPPAPRRDGSEADANSTPALPYIGRAELDERSRARSSLRRAGAVSFLHYISWPMLKIRPPSNRAGITDHDPKSMPPF